MTNLSERIVWEMKYFEGRLTCECCKINKSLSVNLKERLPSSLQVAGDQRVMKYLLTARQVLVAFVHITSGLKLTG